MLSRLQMFFVAGALLAGCSSEARSHRGVWYLRWSETPGSSAATRAAPEADRVKFAAILSWDADAPPEGGFAAIRTQLRQGDVIAYRMTRWEADRKLLLGQFNAVGYRLYRYGHLAVLMTDPERGPELRQFSSQSFKGVNTDEVVDELEQHRFDVYRLDQWARVDVARMHEFMRIAKIKAGTWQGYDFAGMFALANTRLDPHTPDEIGRDYICSTTVLAAFQYAGVQLDAACGAGLVPMPGNEQHGVGDLVTPLQVVASTGFLRPPPQVELVDIQR
jgi:hypothetical protein